MPSDLVLKAMNTVHKGVLKASGGRLGWRTAGMPALELTTTGRRSGRPHTVMLTSPVQDDDGTVVVVASRGGDDHHPAWFLNLRDQPRVEVAYEGGRRQAMTATVADAEARARLWPKVVAEQKRYAGYQRRTDREIPLVLLRPAADDG